MPGEIRLLIVPYEVAGLRTGVGRGPERLLECGAEEALAASGATVRPEVLQLDEELTGRTGTSEAGAAFALITLVADRVRDAIDAGDFPVLLSGSCFVAVGVVAGLGESSPGVVWLDAHGDFNTPESSIDGYFDGMGLAVLTGSAWKEVRALAVEGEPLPETAVLLAGARDLDPLEEARLDASQIHTLPPAGIDSDDSVVRAASSLHPEPTGYYVHLDLDVLDVDEAPVNVYSVDGGLDADQLDAQIHSLLDGMPVRAVSLTAYDPDRDPETRLPPIANRILGTVGRAVAERA